jgi:aminopeptidase YwaD
MLPSIDLAGLATRLRQHVEALAATPREPDTDEHRRAAEYVRRHLVQAGLTVQELPSESAGVSCRNLYATPLPADESLPLLIVGAHYDTPPGIPGADDNASGVAALLELAAWVGPQLPRWSPAARLQLVAYDREEYNLIGSRLHSRRLHEAGTPLLGMISLEMLGYTDHHDGSQKLPEELAGMYPDVGNFIGVCGNAPSQPLVQVVTAALKSVPGLPVEFIAVPGRGEMVPETRLSDHSPFWDHDFQALMITDTSFYRNPHYHEPSDTPQTLDYPFLARVTAGVCEAVRRLLLPASSA